MLPIRDTIPSRSFPVATLAVIFANCAVFVYELGLTEPALKSFFQQFAVIPVRYTELPWTEWTSVPIRHYWPLLTSMFIHGGWLHILTNMWMLWIFGDNVEDRMGSIRFLLFYFLCGVLAGALHVMVNPGSTVPTVGASGAIAGVMGAYLVLYPFASVIALIPIFFWPLLVPVPAFAFLLFWFWSQLYSGMFPLASASDVGGVAWWAHIGGFLSGAISHWVFTRPERVEAEVPAEDDWLSRTRHLRRPRGWDA